MAAPTHPAPDVPGPVWTAAAVARRLGVAPGTLRSWSRRYGIGPAAHTPGRHRRYTATDVAELDRMCELVAQGVVLAAAAAIVRGQRAPPTSPLGPPGSPPAWTPQQAPADAVEALVAAGASLDSDTATGLVAASMGAHGVIATWEDLCLPALDGLDAAVATDPGCTDAQLLLSWAISTGLRRAQHPRWGSDARTVLLACATGEQHTLGLEALAALLIEHRIPARMLGAAVPRLALLHAARQLRPAAVVVWAQRTLTAKPTGLHRLNPLTDAVLAAGPGWRRGALPTRVIRVDTLTGALETITAQHLDRPAESVRAPHPSGSIP